MSQTVCQRDTGSWHVWPRGSAGEGAFVPESYCKTPEPPVLPGWHGAELSSGLRAHLGTAPGLAPPGEPCWAATALLSVPSTAAGLCLSFPLLSDLAHALPGACPTCRSWELLITEGAEGNPPGSISGPFSPSRRWQHSRVL